MKFSKTGQKTRWLLNRGDHTSRFDCHTIFVTIKKYSTPIISMISTAVYMYVILFSLKADHTKFAVIRISQPEHNYMYLYTIIIETCKKYLITVIHISYKTTFLKTFIIPKSILIRFWWNFYQQKLEHM